MELQFFQHLSSKRLSFPHCILFPLLSSINCHKCEFIAGVAVLSIGLCICICVSIVLFLMIVALQYHLKSGSMITTALFFFLKIVLVIWGLLYFSKIFRISFSSSVKNAIGILIEIELNL